MRFREPVKRSGAHLIFVAVLIATAVACTGDGGSAADETSLPPFEASISGSRDLMRVRWSEVPGAARYRVRLFDGDEPIGHAIVTDPWYVVPIEGPRLVSASIAAEGERGLLAVTPLIPAMVLGTGLRSPGPSSVPFFAIDFPTDDWLDAVCGDFNGDGFEDIAIVWDDFPSEGELQVLLGSELGLHAEPWFSSPAQTDDVSRSLLPADFNEDGSDDLLVRGLDGDVACALLGSPDGMTPGGCVSGPSPGSSMFPYEMLELGDVNGDGLSDFMLAEYIFDGSWASDYREYLYLGADGGPQEQPAVRIDEGEPWSVLQRAGDIDGDGRDEVAMRLGNTTRVRRWTGAAFSTGGDWTLNGAPLLGTDEDLSGDGIHDLVTAVGDRFQILVATTAGGFLEVFESAPIQPLEGIGGLYTIADVTHDGRRDVVYRGHVYATSATEVSATVTFSHGGLPLACRTRGKTPADLVAVDSRIQVHAPSPLMGPAIQARMEDALAGSQSSIAVTLLDATEDAILTCSVAWGDGTRDVIEPCTAEALEVLPHTFTKKGTHGATVTVSDSFGFAAAATFPVEVRAP